MGTKKKSQKIIVRETATTFSPYDFEGTLVDVQEHLSALVREYGPDARLDYSSHGSGPYSENPDYSLTIEREETDEEMEKRLASQAAANLQQEARDRAELKRLQEKLGVK